MEVVVATTALGALGALAAAGRERITMASAGMARMALAVAVAEGGRKKAAQAETADRGW